MNVVLLGGGLDSTAVLLYLRNRRTPDMVGMWIDYGQKAHKGELNAVKYFLSKYEIPLVKGKMPMNHIATASILSGEVGKEASDNRLELRNLGLISYACILCASNGGGTVHLGFHQEPEGAPFPDAQASWLETLEKAIQLASPQMVHLSAPFQHMSRYAVLRQAYAIDEKIINHAYTCYEDPDKWGGECGECVHCKQKAEMLERLEKQRL
jgi:7-cyano-7-deazaguanine synthase in queuosine biosynthesis